MVDSEMPREEQDVPAYRFGPFELETRTGELRKFGVRIQLQEQPRQILLLLLEHAGEIVSREQIRTRLWPDNIFVDFDNAINSAVRKVRDALGDTAETPRFLETLARRGYRFIAPLSLDEAREVEPRPEATARPAKQGRWRLAAALAVGLGLPRRGYRSVSPVEFIENGVGASPQVLAPNQAAGVSGQRRSRVWTYATAAIALFGVPGTIWWYGHSVPLPPPSQPVPLTSYLGTVTSPDFSPDGSQVAFAWNGGQRGKRHIYVKPIGSANYLQLTKGDAEEEDPRWSPDGQWIAFDRKGSDGWRTFLMSPIGGNERKLYDGSCAGLAWTSSSKALACASSSGLILISVENGEIRQLTSRAKDELALFPEFSPDGESLLFLGGKRGDCDLFLLALNKGPLPRGTPRRITAEHASTDIVSGATWTPGGRDAVWAMSKALPYATTLYRVPVFGKGPIQPLPFVGRNVFSPTVARRRNRLVYERWSLGIDIWRADGHTAERDPVSSTELEWNAQFSPDCNRIAFESNRSGPQEIWVANTDGTDPVQLTNFGRDCGSPRWSPDGRWITFDAVMTGGGREVWIIESQGGKPRRLTSGPGNSFAPSFSHDAKWIYIGNDRSGRSEIFRVPFGGGTAIQLTHLGGEAPQESNDGRRIYYVGPKLVLHELSLAGGDEHPLGVDVASRAFQVMQDGVYFIPTAGEDGSRRKIQFYDFATRDSRVIQSLGSIGIFFGLSVSPNHGAFLYSVAANNGHNLMLVENFR